MNPSAMDYFMDVVMPKTFFSKILERLKDKGENCFAVCITKVVNGWHFLKSKVTNALNWSSSSDDEDERFVLLVLLLRKINIFLFETTLAPFFTTRALVV